MNGYERVEKGKEYYYINQHYNVQTYREVNDIFDDSLYNVANYYSDKTVAENNARAEKLMNQLRRFAVENNDKDIDWENIRIGKYEICFDYDENEIFVNDYSSIRMFGQIYFTSEEIAKQAIDAFHDELLWYFTEYCDFVYDNKTEEKYGCELCSDNKLNNVGISENRIAVWGCNSKPDKEQRLKFCPNCGRKLED